VLASETLAADQALLRGSFAPQRAGRYMLRATLVREGEAVRRRFTHVLVGEEIEESTELAAKRENFLRYCPATRLYETDQGEQLLTAIMESSLRNRVEREHLPVFETPAFLLALATSLLCEWYLRRRFNLL
jgi:hypothetical protein